ncbi:hypothetical protein [Falsiroseomonas ponticola]|uniref:hypothetical protein n=1 Tax=Falsiroseomonas ponticola TaxID=2786951 RepID=UPI0019346175|nr:hypothetical protein [Roseomonas ponticola]
MGKPEKLVRLSRISLRDHDLSIDLDWRYPQLFEYLQVSPSYRLAHRIAMGMLARDARPLPADFADVERTYAAFGSVYRCFFDDWWIRTAQFRFGASAKPRVHGLLKLTHGEQVDEGKVNEVFTRLDQYLTEERPSEGLPAAVLVAIPVSHDRRRMLRAVAELIERELGPETAQEGVVEAKLLDNKIRERTVATAMRALLVRASSPKTPLYKVGNHLGLAPHYWTDPERPRSDDQDVKRRLMEIVTARQLRRAYLLSEHAARGRFPCLDPLPPDPNRPEFNYATVGKLLWDYVAWGRKHVAKLKARKAEKQRQREALASTGEA